MKIYYLVNNEIDEYCLQKCPFENIGLHGESGKQCHVGSVACKECEFCYGFKKSGYIGLPVNDKIRFYNQTYIKCMFTYKNKFKYKVIQFFYRIIRNIKIKINPYND